MKKSKEEVVTEMQKVVEQMHNTDTDTDANTENTNQQ